MADPEPIAVRAGRPEDFAAMTEAFVAAARAAWPHIFPADTLARLAPPARWDPAEGAAALVAEVRGRVVGFVVLRRSGDDDAGPEVGEVDGFYVAPDLWGTGVGRALLAAALDGLRASGFREATLWTEARNERPRRIYLCGGWRLDGTERRRVHLGAALVELRHRIPLV